MLYGILTVLLFGLSFLAGLMGPGVAFIATPVLGLFGFELKHEIMPLSLWLNGVTAIAGAVTFARKGLKSSALRSVRRASRRAGGARPPMSQTSSPCSWAPVRRSSTTTSSRKAAHHYPTGPSFRWCWSMGRY